MKLALLGGRLSVTASAFAVQREHVFTEVETTVFFNDQATWDWAVDVNNLTDQTYFTTALGAGARAGDPRSVFLKIGIRR